ncbi:transcriptional regulator [Opitutaceae bacterium TAV1]|nr:transcriptional regulator [Opitutaceae bacterium TAV1]
MTTLRQIADKAGTTVATVSRALRGALDISAARKQEIREIAAQLGYRRNPHVSTLMRHIRQGRRDLPHKATIALLFSHALPLPPVRARREIVFVNRRFNGIEARLAERGYQAETFWLNDPDCQPAQLNRILRARGIRGVCLLLFSQPAITIDLDWKNFALATQSDFLGGPSLHRVAEDYFANTLLAMTRLWESGCRRIALAYTARHIPSARFRITAAWRRFLELGGDILAIDHPTSSPAAKSREIPIWTSSDEAWNERAFMAWFRRERPDAILTFDYGDMPRWLVRAGVRIPEDVSIAVLNRCPSAPEFSGVDPEPERLGAMSVDLVIEQLENNETGLPANPKILTIPGRWVTGQTTRTA